MFNKKRKIDFKYAPSIIQTCIGFEDDYYKTIVREDGSLNYNYGFEKKESDDEFELDLDELRKYDENISPYTKVNDKNIFFKHRLKPEFTHDDKLINVHQEYEDPAIPFVTTIEEYEDTKFSWKTFAYKNDKGLRADIIVWTLEASDDFGRAPSKVELISKGYRDGLPKIIESKGTTNYWIKGALRLPGLNHYQFLKSGEKRKGVFVIVLDGEISPEKVTIEWAKEAEKSSREHWQKLKLYENDFKIPNKEINDMLKACARNILQAREIKNEVCEFQVGPTVYRGLWIVDGYFLLEAAHIMGKNHEAFEQGLLAILKRVKPSGAISIIPGHFKETGISIATIVRQCELMDNDERLKELWPTMLRGLKFIKGLREKAKKEGTDYKGYDLFPPAFLDGGISGPFPEYTTPLWILFGLKDAYEVGKRLELEGYEEFKETFTEIMEGFNKSVQRDLRETEDGITYIPMNMEEREGYDKPQSATWALAQAIYPGELFKPEHEYVQNFLKLLDSVDNKQGLPEETGWIHDQGIWPYSGMFYAQVWLYAGYPEKAVDYLYAFANHAAPSRVWREEQTLNDNHSSEFCGDMPHNWGSAEFIRLVRNLLIFEKNNKLELLYGLPEEWLPKTDNNLTIEKTPTKFGTISLELSKVNNEEYLFEFSREEGNKIPKQINFYWKGEVLDNFNYINSLGSNKWSISTDKKDIKIRLSKI